MSRRLLGSLDHLLPIRIVLQPRDVLGNRALKQHHALRQIADIAAQHIRVILIQRGPIQPHLAPRRFP
jgi:hypothetical protein